MPGPHQQVRQASAQRARELGPPQVEDEGRQALEELDHDVAEDRVADDDVGHVGGQVLALDVALEAQVGRVEQLGGALDPGVALALLLADRQQRDARLRDAQHALGEDRAHPRVLDEVLGGRVGVGADVEEDHRPVRGDHLDGEGRAIDAGQPAEAQDRGGHPGAGVTGGHDRVGLAALDEVDGDEDRRVLLLAQGQRGMLVHPDDLAGVDDRDVGREVAGDAADRRLVTDEDHPVLGVRPGVVEGARDDLGRTVIAAHRVDRDADPGALGAGGLGLGLGHRVSARRRRPGLAAWAGPRGGPGSSRSSGRRDAAASSRGSASTPRASARRWRGATRRSPWRACETRRLGTPMGSGAPSDHRRDGDVLAGCSGVRGPRAEVVGPTAECSANRSPLSGVVRP